MIEREALPPVHEADLTLDLLRELFTQLESSSQIQEIRVQSQRERLSGSDARSQLAALRESLVDGAIHGVQIRYRHEGVDWVDTLLRRPQAVRLIRTRASG